MEVNDINDMPVQEDSAFITAPIQGEKFILEIFHRDSDTVSCV